MLSVDVEHLEGGGFEAAVDWRTSLGTRSLLVGLAALVFMLAAGSVGGVGFATRTGVPGMVFLATAAAGLLYVAAAKWLNATTVTVDQRMLSVSIGPLPWAGGVRIPIDDIEQLDVSARVGNYNRIHDFRVHARLANGERRTLVHNLASAPDAQFLLEHLEDALGFE